ncbi:unnamed protein product [Rotaria sordida]|uniref:Uncharacterized protein n=2 Tax=Rotaria sordida TaxID=392033 RepID=A0A814LND7_9BILA|nr:unnamed protein product [Rotaria sordida]
MEKIISKTKSQSVHFHDIIVQIQTVIFNDIECLCLEDVQRRFPSVTVLCVDNVQLSFLRDMNGNQLTPLRIEAIKDQIIEAIIPIEKSNDEIYTFFDRIDIKMQDMNKKTDIILANTQETLVRIKHVMTQMYELHEYTTPRYFFILPVKHHNWTSINTVQNLFLLHYKLYFLCECSNEPDKLHIAPHDGYSVKKPNEFIANYGSYLRTTLNIARSLFSIGSFVIPQSENVSTVVVNTLPSFIKESNNYTDINNKLDLVEKMLNQTNNEISHVDSSMIRKTVLPETSLQGAQLRELEAFLELVDNKHSLGNLYRTITNDGHVRWVCLEHYHTMSFHNKMSEYIHQLETFGGKFNQETKEVILTGTLTTKNITMFCNALTKGFTILTLILQNCSFNTKDLDKLFDVIINRSSIQRLVIMTVEVYKWMKISKYVCNNMIVYFKNQSLKVQFCNHHQNEDTKILIQLLQQNKICRTFNFFGYDLLIQDQDLLHCLKENKELTTLIINHFMNIEFLNEIITSNCSPTRIKLSYCFNLSSTLFSLCQALGQNENLVDLDIIDQTCINDKGATIELLNVLRKHKSIKHVHLHVFNVQPSNQNENCLIISLLNDSLISHLRISESIISHQFIDALVHASKERHSLTYLEFYNCQLNEDDISILQLLYTNESLTHLLISKQQYISVAITEMRQQLVNEFSQYQNTRLEQKIAQSYIHSSICLDNMDLIDQDMEIIVKQAIITKQCNFISLQFNKFTSIGISILADALNNNNTLETLYLGNNYISDDGIYFLANILSINNHTLKILVLQKNKITDRGVKYLAQMIKVNQTLIWLYLGQNEISDEGVRILTQTIQNQNHTIEMLVLSGNKLLTDLSIDYLIQMIQHNQSLKKLWIDDCNLSELGKERLNKIQQTKKDFYISL